LFEALQRRAVPEIEALIDQQRLADTSARMLLSLAELNGEDALDRAVTELAGADKSVQVALSHLQKVADETRRWLPEVPIHFDLTELRGYYYKTGVVFAAFIPGWGQEIARGGRYDDIGRVFGRSRPAVGFSTDLKGLLRLGTAFENCYEPTDKVFAPWSSDPVLQREITRLRREGRRVVTELPGQNGGARELGCSERLERRKTRWVLAPVQNP
jgi:ATP phosphoribosyltransferase regulatory subunit